MDTECIEYTTCEKAGTKVYLAVDGQYAGCILITDEVKPDSKKAISDLETYRRGKTVMLTGDDEKIGKSVAEELQLDKYYAQLLPDQKVEKVELLDSKRDREANWLLLVMVSMTLLSLPVQMLVLQWVGLVRMRPLKQQM